jgi:small-conductance mechanosensitive channel
MPVRVLNQSSPKTRKRVHVGVGVAYGTDTHVVRSGVMRFRWRRPDATSG